MASQNTFRTTLYLPEQLNKILNLLATTSGKRKNEILIEILEVELPKKLKKSNTSDYIHLLKD